MLNNKRAQVGDAMTWMVATLVIVAILGISVSVTYSISDKKTIILGDKEKDFIATKSITNFLENRENVGLLNEENSKISKEKIKLFLNTLSVNSPRTLSEITQISSAVGKKEGGWNLEIDGSKKKVKITTSAVYNQVGNVEFPTRSKSNFELRFSFGKKKLRFWAECTGGKCK